MALRLQGRPRDGRPFLEPLQQFACRQRLAHVKALRVVAAEYGQGVPGLPGVDALGHDLEAEVVREIDHGAHDHRIVLVLLHVDDERLVDFDFVHRQLPQMRERGVAGAEIVDGEGDAHAVELAQNGKGVGGIGHDRVFGDFQREVLR